MAYYKIMIIVLKPPHLSPTPSDFSSYFINITALPIYRIHAVFNNTLLINY